MQFKNLPKEIKDKFSFVDEYVDYGANRSILDGNFGPDELRRIADIMDELKKKVYNYSGDKQEVIEGVSHILRDKIKNIVMQDWEGWIGTITMDKYDFKVSLDMIKKGDK